MIGIVQHRRKVPAEVERALRAAVADAGIDRVAWVDVPKAKKARAAVSDLLGAGVATVIVAGGDGTVRAAAEALVGTGVPLAVLPTGTANLFAGALGLPSEPAGVVRAALSGSRRVLDTGRCNDRTFTVMAGVGVDAGMIHRADGASGLFGKKRLGFLSYVWAGITEARRRESFVADVRLDGEAFYTGPATCVLVGNLGDLQGDVKAFPDAAPDDGRLDVGVVTARGLRQWASLMVSTVRGRPGSSAYARLGQAREIDVRLDGEHRIELDGGTKGRRRCMVVGVRPASLVVCAAPAAGSG